jgi:hypothetical protein
MNRLTPARATPGLGGQLAGGPEVGLVGERVEAAALAAVGADERVRARLHRCVAVLGRMVAEGWFVGHEDSIGMEVEFDLIDPLGRPRLVNEAVLSRLGRTDVQYELGQFNLEVNLAPRPLAGSALAGYERELAAILVAQPGAVARLGAQLLAVGTLPTLSPEHLTYQRLSANPRYALLSQRMRAARQRPFRVRIDGVEPVSFSADCLTPQAAATSLQLHLRVPPQRFAAFHNAAQLVAAAQVAAGANAPYLLGQEVWQETRIALVEQMLDTRLREEVVAGRPRRVRLGDRWVTGPVELFEEIVRWFPPLLPVLDEEDPDAAFEAGRVPGLCELRLHNGTVWRWNRPVYDVQAGHPQLRIENRVLPSGPTAADMAANAAFYFGLVRTLADTDPPPWAGIPFRVVEQNLHEAARHGLHARLRWRGRVLAADRLVLDELLPAAASGLDAWGVDRDDRDRYLGIIESRARSGQTGAAWQTATVHLLEQHHKLERAAALREMTRRYSEHARHGAPVHSWPLP